MNDSSIPQSPKKSKRRPVHDFLLETFFTEPHHYEPKVVGNFVLVRQKDNNNDSWEVAVWTKETWDKVQTIKMSFMNDGSDT